MARYAVLLKGLKDNSEAGKKAFIERFASAYKMPADKALKLLSDKKGEIYSFDDYDKAIKAKAFLDNIGGYAEIRDNAEVETDQVPQLIEETTPSPSQERKSRESEPVSRPTGPLRVVFLPLADIHFPKRCVGCNIEEPSKAIILGVMPATKMSTGTTLGALGGGAVGGLVGMLAGAAISGASGQTQSYVVPICEKCLAGLSKQNKNHLMGRKDGALFGTYEVDTPVMKREIIKKCVVVTFYNPDYGLAFVEANKGKVFDTVEEAKKSKSSGKETTEEDLNSKIKTLLGEYPIQPMAEQTPEFENKVIDILNATGPADGFYVAPDIPDNMLANARKACKAPYKERFLGLIDCTVFGSAKRAILIGAKGIYFPPLTADATPFDCVNFYKDLHSYSFIGGSKYELYLLSGKILDISGALADKTEITAVLEAIRYLLAGYDPSAFDKLIRGENQDRLQAASGGTALTDFGAGIEKILSVYSDQQGFFMKDKIPAKKLKNAVQKCEIPQTETVLALIDLTVFGSAKNCLVFGKNGIYFHNDFAGKSPGAFSIPYQEIAKRSFEKGGFQEIQVGDNVFLNIAAAQPEIKNNIPRILNEIKRLALGIA